jgi:hypothetical protein
MNQRIRELAEQATTRIEPTATSGEGWIFDKEKFAELIVAECINRCAYAPDVSEDWYQGVKWVANEIAQHFGVEL